MLVNKSHISKPGIPAAIVSAALFGLSPPLVKILLGEIPPLFLTGLLYLGSGFGLTVIQILRNFLPHEKKKGEAPLKGKDYLWLLGAILCGGILAPIMLVVGLSTAQASTSSLLLNFEGILTTLVAYLIFREAIGARVWWATVFMLVGGLVLTFDFSTSKLSFSKGSLLVVGACLMWALDNNLTRNVSDKDPFTIACTKGLIAGTFSIALAFITSQPIPTIKPLLGAMLVGAFCYGISLALFVYALRHLGSARTGTYFGMAPFLGTVFSVILLKESITPALLIASIFMAIGAWLLLNEEHSHYHKHEPLEHEHRHSHDEHHLHKHETGMKLTEPHSHLHKHEPLEHEHAHTPDIHHRHWH